jgi:Ca2+-binding RTX toxin-like protein
MASSTRARRRRARKLATLVTVVACFTALSAQSQADVLDQGATVAVPTITAGDVEVLGPSTVRVRGIIDTGNLATTVYLRYGDGSVLDQRTASFTIGAGLVPTQVIEDLLDLEPGGSYQVQIVAETPAGTVASNSIPFTLPAAVFVDPTTGGIVSSRSRAKGKRLRCTIVGTARSDKLVGTRKRDVICGLGGNDRITGAGGNDLILAGTGNDRASGGKGNDRIYGNSGRDRMFGNAGADRFYDNGDGKVTAAKRNRDVVSGGSGRDRAKVNRGDRVRSVERVFRRR